MTILMRDPMIIRPMTVADAAILRDVRLRALSDAPLAFGSTYARESAFTDDQWNERAAKWTTPGSCAAFLAFDGSECCGIIASFRREADPSQFVIVSMWVAPHARRKGLARRLLTCAEEWAIASGAAELFLDVTETNEAAILLYKRFGFDFTREDIPYPNAPNLRERVMKKTCWNRGSKRG